MLSVARVLRCKLYIIRYVVIITWVQPIDTQYITIFTKLTSVTRVPWARPINT